jgi:hypothetical protein
MHTGVTGRGLNRDMRVKIGDRLHDDGLGGDAQTAHHKDRELMVDRDLKAEPVEQLFIGLRWCFEEQDARRIALRQEICCRGCSGDFVIEDRHEICWGQRSLFDEQPAQLGEYRFAPYPQGCRSEKEKEQRCYA